MRLGSKKYLLTSIFFLASSLFAGKKKNAVPSWNTPSKTDVLEGMHNKKNCTTLLKLLETLRKKTPEGHLFSYEKAIEYLYGTIELHDCYIPQEAD